MKKPTLRVAKWLGDIPVEAGCSACPGVVFRAKGSGHRPNREEYQKSIQAQFDEHCNTAHSQE
jgi:hypothetical protein